ncbi:hypothetical protein BDN70DRAFT_806989 [Pholiota conissans]|uniref:Glycosyltransferase 61 catalytic domain-containing protein n=1 Tax=Pholiota conissans TaxID=109636 RepID=A0A9P6CTK2_9AGAR|nr:hypothetical protein BDN70DRAFT_806989 [Pholiota conissans]
MPIEETTLAGGMAVPGFNVFDRLYVWNGTIYAVTSDPKAFPELRMVLSRPGDVKSDHNMDPTPSEMQIISPAEAKLFLGESAVVIEGMSFILWDTNQFMAHYYHWWGELILGAMRVYSSLSLLPGIKTPLAQPQRFILPNINGSTWRDRAGVDGPLMRAGWPFASIEQQDFWRDLARLNQTFVFERAMIVCRPAAHKSPLATLWYKMISSSMNVTAPPDFWQPLQRRVIRNAVGYLPELDENGKVLSEPRSKAPVVTYISRQGGVRRLTSEAHEGLVDALRGLESEGLCELNVVAMENLTFSAQLEMVARTTVMVGVHGNGLTHQLWMPSSPRSTVVEIFFPKSYLHDYEILARNIGHKHYAIWNDSSVTYPPGKWFKGVEQGDRTNFNGYAIPVHGPTVAEVVRDRLTTFTP